MQFVAMNLTRREANCLGKWRRKPIKVIQELGAFGVVETLSVNINTTVPLKNLDRSRLIVVCVTIAINILAVALQGPVRTAWRQ